MSTDIQFPQGPFIEPNTGRLALEWFMWLQNPQFISVNLGTVLDVTSGGTGESSLTAHGVLLGADEDAIVATAAMADGELLIGQTDADPEPTAMSGAATLAADGTLTLANVGTAGTYTKTTFNAKGLETSGTAAILASADYANQGTAVTVLHGDAAGNPSWAAVSLTADVTGTLGVTKGGTGLATIAANRIPYATASDTFGSSSNFIFDGTTFTTPGQVAFPATQNPSTNANTLDDYEEGTFTPTFTFATPGNLSVTYTVQVGAYVKVGKLVQFTYRMTFTPTFTTAVGNAQFLGIPFASENVANQVFGLTVRALSAGYIWPVAVTSVEGTLAENSSIILLTGMGSAIAAANFTIANLTSGVAHTITFSGCYIASA